MKYMLILILDIICTIDSTYTLIDYLCNEEISLIHHFSANTIVLSGYSIVVYHRSTEYQCNETDETIGDEDTNWLIETYFYITHRVIFITAVSDVWCLISVYQLELVSFRRILYIVLSLDMIYIQFQSIITSIITILLLLLNSFIQCLT